MVLFGGLYFAIFLWFLSLYLGVCMVRFGLKCRVVYCWFYTCLGLSMWDVCECCVCFVIYVFDAVYLLCFGFVVPLRLT